MIFNFPHIIIRKFGEMVYPTFSGICEQPGFLAGTNFLLPWDVTVKVQDREKWPAIADTLGKKALMLKNKKNRGGGWNN